MMAVPERQARLVQEEDDISEASPGSCWLLDFHIDIQIDIALRVRKYRSTTPLQHVLDPSSGKATDPASCHTTFTFSFEGSGSTIATKAIIC